MHRYGQNSKFLPYTREWKWLLSLQSVFVLGFLRRTRGSYTQCKTAHKHSFLVQKHTYDRKEQALSSLQCLQSTLYMVKTGNRMASTRCATRLTERSHSLSYRTRVLLTHDRVLPGVPSRKRTANERAIGPLPCRCKSLVTINMASLYLGYSSKLEAVSLQVKAKQDG